MLKLMLLSFTAAILLLVGTSSVIAQTLDQNREQACKGAGGTFDPGSGVCQTAGESRTLPDIIKAVTNILIYIVGAVSVLMLIIGGLRYALSGGDSAGVEGAKNTILYAIIGIVVAFTAYAIVNFIIFGIVQGG